MILQILVRALASFGVAIGVVSLIGLRRLAEGVAIIAISVPLALVLFVVALAGLVIYRLH